MNDGSSTGPAVVEVEISSVQSPPAQVSPVQRLVRSPLIWLGLAVALAVGMWMVDFQPVSSDSTKVTAAYEPGVGDEEFLNLKSPVWSEDRRNDVSKETDLSGNQTHKLSTTVIPLSAQYIAAPQGGSILQVKARAAFNDKTLAVLVQWQDNTRNVGSQIAQSTYSDAAAIEFPLQVIPGHQPFRCMGQSDAEVNIWQWKAERQPEVAGDARILTEAGGKAVKNYIGPGLGYLKDSSAVNPDSNASYDEATHTWSVVYRRSLIAGDNKSATQFTPGQATTIAFAVWDGGAGERLSKKAVSTWVDFILQPGEQTTQSLINILTLIGVGVLMVVAVVVAWRILPNPNRK